MTENYTIKDKPNDNVGRYTIAGVIYFLMPELHNIMFLLSTEYEYVLRKLKDTSNIYLSSSLVC